MRNSEARPPDDSNDRGKNLSRLGALMSRRPIAFTLAFEGGLAVLALLLALAFGLQPWSDMTLHGKALLQSVLATALAVAAVLSVMQMRWQWVGNLERIVQEQLLPLFRNARALAVLAVALMAGIGEELLFRGVIQTGLSGLTGPIPALAIASLLFGLAHALTLAYFVLTCIMGLYLGWLYQATGNLMVPITVHFLYDWIVLSWYLAGAQRRI